MGQSAALWKAMEHSDEELRVQLQNALHVPGCLHIFHNMTKDIIGSLEHFEVWVGQLQAVAKVCSKPWSKRRLLATCFSSTDTMPFRPEIERFSCHVHPGRWGSVAHAIGELLKVKRALQSGWNVGHFLYNQAESRPAGRDPDEEADNSAEATQPCTRPSSGPTPAWLTPWPRWSPSSCTGARGALATSARPMPAESESGCGCECHCDPDCERESECVAGRVSGHVSGRVSGRGGVHGSGSLSVSECDC